MPPSELETPFEIHRAQVDRPALLRVRRDGFWRDQAVVDVAIPALVHLSWLLGFHDDGLIELDIVDVEVW